MISWSHCIVTDIHFEGLCYGLWCIFLYTKRILESRTKQIQFIMNQLQDNRGKLEEKRPDFFKLRCVSISTIQGQRHLSTVLMHL